MKRLLLIALLMVPNLAITYTWDYWEDRCSDDFTDFAIYENTSSYRGSSGMLVVEIEPKLDILKYMPEYSTASFAEFNRPMIPGVDYPSTLSMRISTNYTFFIPFGFSTNDFSIEIVTNNSEGEPRCSNLGWEINESRRFNDENITFGTSVLFNPNTKKFEYNVSNGEEEDIRFFFSIFSNDELFESTSTLISPLNTEGDNIQKVSQLTYESIDVAAGIYQVFIVAATDEKSFFGQHQIFEFYDFEVSVPELPNFRPGETYNIPLTIINTGYKTDSYDLDVSVGDGWEFSITDPGELDKGQDNDIDFSYTVPDLQIGLEILLVNVTSTRSGVTKSFELDLSPEKITTLEVSTREIPEVVAYANNNMSVVVISSGTIDPELYYYVYSEPALLIRDGVATMTAYVGEINKRKLEFYVGGSCAMSNQDSQAFNAGRKTLMFSKAIYFLSSNMDEDTTQTLIQLGEMIEVEKLKMTTDSASKLFSSSESLTILIERLVEGFEDNRSLEYYRPIREDLYLYTIDLDALLNDVGSTMAESCSSVDEVNLRLFAIDLATLQTRDIPKIVPIVGPKIIEFIGPSKLKAISGSSVYFDYVLKNNAGEGFEVDFIPSTDIILLPSFVYLPADSSKDIELRVRPPEYFEADELITDVEVKTRTYNLKFPLTLTVGVFDPEIISDRDYAISPGVEDYFNISLRTGGLDDTFRISIDGPSWVSGPERLATQNSEASITIYVNPPVSASGSEYVEISVVSETFTEYVSTESFDIFISSDAQSILERLNEDESLLITKVDLLSQQSYVEASRYLTEARRDVSQNEFSSAKLNLKKAENIIFSVTEEESSSLSIIIAVVTLIIGAGVFWKFLLPKIRGTSSEAPITQEVI
ncbi:MAG: hypothetical protein GOU98_03605 [Candidatus Altiarchaeota archaeon]|nr:hypothetical protein [Candidatus Altiarchaeota archaeon]